MFLHNLWEKHTREVLAMMQDLPNISLYSLICEELSILRFRFYIQYCEVVTEKMSSTKALITIFRWIYRNYAINQFKLFLSLLSIKISKILLRVYLPNKKKNMATKASRIIIGIKKANHVLPLMWPTHLQNKLWNNNSLPIHVFFL